jgi:hypothetical protein
MDAELILLPQICEEGLHFRVRTCEAIPLLIVRRCDNIRSVLRRTCVDTDGSRFGKCCC